MGPKTQKKDVYECQRTDTGRMGALCAPGGAGSLEPGRATSTQDLDCLDNPCGRMGGPAALCLAMAGVGRIIIAHGGALISPDLNRQVLGCEAVIGEPRAPHFADYLRSMNRFVEIEAIDHEPSTKRLPNWRNEWMLSSPALQDSRNDCD